MRLTLMRISPDHCQVVLIVPDAEELPPEWPTGREVVVGNSSAIYVSTTCDTSSGEGVVVWGMARRIRLEPHLAVDELERRYRAAKEPHERSWWQLLWLLAKGHTARELAEVTGYSAYWIGQIAKRYNAEGPAGMHNRQYTHSHRAAPLLSDEHLAELAAAVRGPAPAGDHWLGRMVADWMSAQLGRPISEKLGWAYLVRLDGKRRKPRPRHVQADPAAQEAFKKT